MNSRNIFKSFVVQSRVIGALMMRELHTRFGREGLGYLWIIGEPILFCAGVTIAWTAMRPAHEHGLPMTAMVLTGYVPLTMWRHSITVSIKAFEANGSLLFHRQVTPMDILIARVTLEIIGSITAGLLVYAAAYVIGYINLPKNLYLIYVGIMFHSVFSFGSSMIIAALSEQSEFVEKIIGVFSYLSLPFSGAFVMSSWLPPKFQKIIYWSPSAQSIEMIRGGQFGWTSHPIYSFVYTFYIDFSLLLIGIILISRVRKHIQVW